MRSRRVLIPFLLLATTGVLAAGLTLGLHGSTPTAEAQSRDAWLGVALQDLTPELRDAMNIERRVRGALVSRVVPDSPADKAGLKDGDVITEVGGRRTSNVESVISTVRRNDPGEEVLVTVRRGKQSRGLSVTLGTRSQDQDFEWFTPDSEDRADRDVRRHLLRDGKDSDAPRSKREFVFEDDKGNVNRWKSDENEDSDKPGIRDRIRRNFRFRPSIPGVAMEHRGGYLGVQTMELTDQLAGYFDTPKGRGVLVTEVVEGSPADKAGLRAGDVILSFGEATVDSHRELRRSVRRADPDSEVALTVMRKGARKTLEVHVGSTEDQSDLHFGDDEHGTFVFDLDGLEGLEGLHELRALKGLEGLEDLKVLEGLEGLKGMEGMFGKDGNRFRMLFVPEDGDLPHQLKDLDDLKFDFEFDFDEDDLDELHEKLKGLRHKIRIHRGDDGHSQVHPHNGFTPVRLDRLAEI